MNQDVIFFGQDNGNSANKYAMFQPTPEGQDVIRVGAVPNVYSPAIRLTSDPTSPSDQDVLCVEVPGAAEFQGEFFLGHLARVQRGESAYQDRSRDKANAANIQLFAPAILGMLAANQPIVLGIGAALSDYAKQGPAIERYMEGQHLIRYRYGKIAGERQITVRRCYVYGQAIAAIYAHMFPQELHGKARLDAVDKTILCIDFGHGQINAGMWHGRQVVRDASFSIDWGMWRIYEAVREMLDREYGLITTIPQLQTAIERRMYKSHEVDGGGVDLSGYITEQAAILCEDAYRMIRDRMRAVNAAAWDAIDMVLLVGGGANLMADDIAVKFRQRPIVPADALYQNAIGLLMLARDKWGRENGR